MIPALGAGGPGFNSPLSPLLNIIYFTIFKTKIDFFLKTLYTMISYLFCIIGSALMCCLSSSLINDQVIENNNLKNNNKKF